MTFTRIYFLRKVDLEAQDWLLDQFSMSLDEQEQASCEGFLTVEEYREALNGMDTGKSPGIDGLTAEFYIAIWAVIASDLVKFSTTVFSIVSFLSLIVEACCL